MADAGALLEWLLRFTGLVWEDVVFALVLGSVADLALESLAGAPRGAKALHAAYSALCALSVVYGVLSLRIFDYLGTPLTYALIVVGGDLGNMASSFREVLTAPFVTALAAPPVILVTASPECVRLEARSPRAGRAARWGIGAAAVLGVVLPGMRAGESGALNMSERRLSKSAHTVLATSVLASAFGPGVVRFASAFREEDLLDFEPAGARLGPGATTSTAREFATPMTGKALGRNVIVLVLESVGAQLLGLYGDPADTTPRLSAEAGAHGLTFDAFYCHVGGSSNSLFAITLGRYPPLSWRDATLLEPRARGTALAEPLRARGYRTAYLEAGDLTWAGWRDFLEGRGYDALRDWRDIAPERRHNSWGMEDRLLVDDVLRFIDQDPARPFHVTAWTVQTHHPYDPSADAPFVDLLAGRRVRDAERTNRYLNALREMDRQVGRLLDGLRARGLAERTLVAVTGDHPETFGFPHGSWSHGFGVHEEDLRVPLLLWAPGLFAGGRAAAIGGHVDLAPTLADLLGIEPAPTWTGRSLFDAERPPRVYGYAAADRFRLSVREGTWRYAVDLSYGRESLFDLAQDPGEARDLASQEPARAQRLKERLGAWVEAGRRSR